MGGAPEGTVAGLSTDYLRAADAAERLQQNLDKDHALLRRFTAGVLHQVRPAATQPVPWTGRALPCVAVLGVAV